MSNEYKIVRDALPAAQDGDDSALLSACYAAMSSAMQLIDPNEGPGLEHSRALNALAECRVQIENRNALRAGITKNEFGIRIPTPNALRGDKGAEAVDLPTWLRWVADELVKRDTHGGTFAPGIAQSLRGRAYVLELAPTQAAAKDTP